SGVCAPEEEVCAARCDGGEACPEGLECRAVGEARACLAPPAAGCAAGRPAASALAWASGGVALAALGAARRRRRRAPSSQPAPARKLAGSIPRRRHHRRTWTRSLPSSRATAETLPPWAA